MCSVNILIEMINFSMILFRYKFVKKWKKFLSGTNGTNFPDFTISLELKSPGIIFQKCLLTIFWALGWSTIVPNFEKNGSAVLKIHRRWNLRQKTLAVTMLQYHARDGESPIQSLRCFQIAHSTFSLQNTYSNVGINYLSHISSIT